MPLSLPGEREPLHRRTVVCTSFRRSDDLWEAEGRLTDTRGDDVAGQGRGVVPQGAPIHDMAIRVAFTDDLVIQAIEVVTDVAPYPEVCPNAAAQYQRLVGLRMDRGFARVLPQRVGGPEGCTHQTELLRAVYAIVVRTSLSHIQKKRDSGTGAVSSATNVPPPGLLNTCCALASDSAVVGQLWPDDRTTGTADRD